MEEFTEEFKDYKVARTVKTCSEHYWVVSKNQDNNSNLLSINCKKCPIGASIDSNNFKVENGKICQA